MILLSTLSRIFMILPCIAGAGAAFGSKPAMQAIIADPRPRRISRQDRKMVNL